MAANKEQLQELSGRHRRTKGQAGMWKDGQTDFKTEMQTKRQTERRINRQTDNQEDIKRDFFSFLTF